MEQEKSLQDMSMQAFCGELPDLSKATPAPLPINGEYWSPSSIGESKRMFFKELRMETVIDAKSGQDVELKVAYFVEPVEGKKPRIIRQGGIRLTSVFDSFVKAGRIVPGMAFEITYDGKQKTGTGNFVDTWTITPLATH